VACCGLTAGTAFQASVFPFILRGVNLLGVDSVEIPLADKADIWRKLAGPWKLEGLERLCHEVGLAELPAEIVRILEGHQVGRALVRVD
jgi:alcohol dehydrogenase